MHYRNNINLNIFPETKYTPKYLSISTQKIGSCAYVAAPSECKVFKPHLCFAAHYIL